MSLRRKEQAHERDRIPVDMIVAGVVVREDSVEAEEWEALKQSPVIGTARHIAFAVRRTDGGLESAFGILLTPLDFDATPLKREDSWKPEDEETDRRFSVLALFRGFLAEDDRRHPNDIVAESVEMFERALIGAGDDPARDALRDLLG